MDDIVTITQRQLYRFEELLKSAKDLWCRKFPRSQARGQNNAASSRARKQVQKLIDAPDGIDWNAIERLSSALTQAGQLSVEPTVLNDCGSPIKKRGVEFLCIGAQKSGTTWLHEQLRRHPDICLPPIKENHYFDYLFCSENAAWIPTHFRNSATTRIRSLIQNEETVDWAAVNYFSRITARVEAGQVNDDWYDDLYACCNGTHPIRGDITPAYLPLPSEGIEAAYRHNPEMKIIVLLREPVSRALSRARMVLKQKQIENPTEKNWRELINGYGVIEKSRYSIQLQNWLHVFPKDQFLILPYEMIAADIGGLVREICAFLSVEQLDVQNLLHERVHPGKDYAVPSWFVHSLESRLADEREATLHLFSHLEDWWQQETSGVQTA